MKGRIQLIRRAAIALLALVVATVAAQALASGGAKVTTRLSIDIKRGASQDVIFGKVRSREHACEANRKVKLRHRTVKLEEKSSVIATLRANSQGKWKYKPGRNQNGDRYATPGFYHVKAGEKRISTGSGELICKARFSPSMYVG